MDKTISTLDQKLRRKLNALVDRGLLDFKIGPNGEKAYYLTVFRLKDAGPSEEGE